MKKISLIIPFYNEETNIEKFFTRLESVIDSLKEKYFFEILCINDGSKDGTLDKLLEYKNKNKNIKVIEFSRNFGKEAAITSGLDLATGAASIPIDSDLQHPPELIIDMLQEWERGFDVVLAKRINRSTDKKIQKMAANTFYKISKHISQITIPADVGDYRLMDEMVVQAVKSLREKNRFMKGIFAWVGFRTTEIFYTVEPRASGRSKFNLWKLWNFAIDGITSFSTLPLRVWTYIGSFVSCLAILYAFWIAIKTLIFGVDFPGYASLMTAILLLSGIQMIGIGVLGEYISRIFIESKHRPIYIIRKVHENID